MTVDSQHSADKTLVNRRAFVAGGLLLAAAGTAASRKPVATYPRVTKSEFDALVPKSAGDWRFETASGLVLPPSDALSDRLYDNLITRIYSRSSGPMVMLLIAYNNRQDGVLQIHRPEICYPAGGYRLTATQPTEITVAKDVRIPSRVFSADSEERNEQVLYWTRIGEDFPRRWIDQRLAVLHANLNGAIPDGLLVRLSTTADDLAAALPVMQNFAASLYAASPTRLLKLLFDRGG